MILNDKTSNDPVLVVHTPEPQSLVSFGWSDFPIVEAAPTLPLHEDSGFNHNKKRLPPPPFPQVTKRSVPPSFASRSIDRNKDLRALLFSDDSSSSLRAVVPKQPSKVKFSTVTVREHAPDLGDHPWCVGDYPLTLDWQYADSVSCEIDDYEAHRRCRRAGPVRRLNPAQRRQRLLAMAPQETGAQLRDKEDDWPCSVMTRTTSAEHICCIHNPTNPAQFPFAA